MAAAVQGIRLEPVAVRSTEEREQPPAALSFRVSWRGAEQVMRGRRAAAGRGEREDEHVQLLEGGDPGTVGADRGAGVRELALDLLDEVAGEHRREERGARACADLSGR